MRILTWNVNVLRTCLDYHPFSSMKKKNVEGFLDLLDAQIFCFQEHKTRRQQLEKSMACPGPYDGFWTFPRSKTGYSGVCTFVDSRWCVPLQAEEGITGQLLGDSNSTMKPPWKDEERIGYYPDIELMDWEDEVDGTSFDTKRLDMEGRAVVCDFGMFILFNLYSPNETNDSRRPYKMNFLHALQERVKLLMAAGREVIIAGDINIVRAPIDSGEGGIRSSAEQHYEHPARRIFDAWCAPRGPMIDVVRESFPDRDDMFTCWNTKIDARPSNYGSRIDYILCSPGLRPWIKGGDIQAKVFGSDHCPVYIDLHDSITTPEGEVLHIRDQLNPPNRPPATVSAYPTEPARTAPEPPRFATKFLDEFSGKQQTLKSFFGGGRKKSESVVSPSPTPAPTETPVQSGSECERPPVSQGTAREIGYAPSAASSSTVPVATPFGLARAAFDSIDVPQPSATGDSQDRIAGGSRPKPSPRPSTDAIDLTEDDDRSETKRASSTARSNKSPKAPPPSKKASKPPPASQMKLSNFFGQPPNKAKRKSPPGSDAPRPPRKRTTTSPVAEAEVDGPLVDLNIPSQEPEPEQGHEAERDPAEEALIAQAVAEADAEREEKRAEQKAKAAPKWNELFAKKLPPLCTVHQKPCKDFTVKIPGPNKGKRFWLCSLPVGAGYDMGRTKRAREDVNHKFRCDFFLWDSANSRKEHVGGSGTGQ